MTVQADESHVFKRKNNVRRLLVFTEHGWLFGMVEDTPNGKLFLTMVKQRDKETLLGIIKKHDRPGTTIFTDSWRGYLGLSACGFLHFMVNHKKNFVSHQRVEVYYDRVGDCLDVIFFDTDFAEDADDETLIDDTLIVHTNRIERIWREVKRGLRGQPLCVLNRNINVEMFRYNYLRETTSLSERRRVVLSVLAKHQSKVEELKRESFSIYPDQDDN